MIPWDGCVVSSLSPTTLVVTICMFCRLRIRLQLHDIRSSVRNDCELHVISNFLFESLSNAWQPLPHFAYQMFLFCLHERIWRRTPYKNIHRSQHIFSLCTDVSLVIRLNRLRLVCVWNACKRSARPIVQFNEGCLWTVSINPHNSVWFVLLSVVVVICMRVVNECQNQLNNDALAIDTIVQFKNHQSTEFKSLFCVVQWASEFQFWWLIFVSTIVV